MERKLDDTLPIGSVAIQRASPDQSVEVALKLARAGASDMAVVLAGGEEGLRVVEQRRASADDGAPAQDAD